MKKLHESEVSKIYYNPDDGLVYKTLKIKKVLREWFDVYKKFQKNAPVVQIVDIVDENTYTMKHVPNIICTVEKYVSPFANEYRGTWSKSNFINLHCSVSETWQNAMRLSKTLPENKFFVSDDIRLKNIVVTQDKNKNIGFQIIDADSWNIHSGYTGVDSYYQVMLKIGLCTSRMVHER